MCPAPHEMYIEDVGVLVWNVCVWRPISNEEFHRQSLYNNGDVNALGIDASILHKWDQEGTNHVFTFFVRDCEWASE